MQKGLSREYFSLITFYDYDVKIRIIKNFFIKKKLILLEKIAYIINFFVQVFLYNDEEMKFFEIWYRNQIFYPCMYAHLRVKDNQ